MIFLTGLMGPVGQLGAVGWQHRGMLSEVLRDPHEANFLGQVAWKLLVADGLVILALNEWLVLGQAYLNHPNFQESQFQIHKLNHCRESLRLTIDHFWFCPGSSWVLPSFPAPGFSKPAATRTTRWAGSL